MALQFVVQAPAQLVKQTISINVDLAEVFEIDAGQCGVSVPTKVIDEVGEDEIRLLLKPWRHYDLYEGQWFTPMRGPFNVFKS